MPQAYCTAPKEDNEHISQEDQRPIATADQLWKQEYQEKIKAYEYSRALKGYPQEAIEGSMSLQTPTNASAPSLDACYEEMSPLLPYQKNRILVKCIQENYWGFITDYLKTNYLKKELAARTSPNLPKKEHLSIVSELKKHYYKDIYLYGLNFFDEELIGCLQRKGWPIPTKENIGVDTQDDGCYYVHQRYQLEYIQSLMGARKRFSNAAVFHILNSVYLWYLSREKELQDGQKSRRLDEKDQLELTYIPSILSALAKEKEHMYTKGSWRHKIISYASKRYYESLPDGKNTAKEGGVVSSLVWGIIFVISPYIFLASFLIALKVWHYYFVA